MRACQSQRPGEDVTEWVIFFLSCLRNIQEAKIIGLIGTDEKNFDAFRSGAAILILSGIGLFIVTGGAFANQIWFKIKLALILVLILNGFLVGSRQESKLKSIIHANDMHYSG